MKLEKRGEKRSNVKMKLKKVAGGSLNLLRPLAKKVIDNKFSLKLMKKWQISKKQSKVWLRLRLK